MGESNSSSTSFANAIKELRMFDGRSPADFRDWHKRLVVVIGVSRRDIANLVKGNPRPTKATAGTGSSPALAEEIAAYERANQDLYAMLSLLTEKPASLLVLKHEDETGTTGDGQKALQELVSKYNKVTDEVIWTKMDKLVNTNMEQGEDPDSYSIEKTLARSELEKMGEMISDRRFKDICVQGFTSEYKDIKMMLCRDPTFDIDQMQSTMRHLYLDDLSRNSDTKIVGRGVAMTAASTCSRCGKQGHFTRNCWERKDDNDSKSTGTHSKQKDKESSNGKAASNVGAEHKWCSVHKTASHDDTECYEQGAPRPPQSGRAHTASAIQDASTRPNDDEMPSLNFDDGFEEGFAFTGLLAGSGNRGFHPKSDRFTMLVDSGASDHLIDEELISRLRKSMRGYKELKDPKTIITKGKKVFATATSTIWGYIIDQAGKRVPVRISATFVTGLGRHVFSSIKAKQSGVSTILETRNPHLQFDSSTSLPLTQHPEDKGVCSYGVFFRTLGNTADTSSTPAVVPAALARNDANLGVCTFKKIQEFCTNSSIAMEHTATVAEEGIRAVWAESCDPKGVHTVRRK